MQCKKSSVLTRWPVSLLSQNTHDYVIQCFMLPCMLGFSGDSSRTWHCQIFYLCTIGIAHHKYVLGKIKLFLKCFLSFFNTKDTMQTRCFMTSQEIIDRLVWYFFKAIICVNTWLNGQTNRLLSGNFICIWSWLWWAKIRPWDHLTSKLNNANS